MYYRYEVVSSYGKRKGVYKGQYEATGSYVIYSNWLTSPYLDSYSGNEFWFTEAGNQKFLESGEKDKLEQALKYHWLLEVRQRSKFLTPFVYEDEYQVVIKLPGEEDEGV
jgi:hypothetical protein